MEDAIIDKINEYFSSKIKNFNEFNNLCIKNVKYVNKCDVSFECKIEYVKYILSKIAEYDFFQNDKYDYKYHRLYKKIFSYKYDNDMLAYVFQHYIDVHNKYLLDTMIQIRDECKEECIGKSKNHDCDDSGYEPIYFHVENKSPYFNSVKYMCELSFIEYKDAINKINNLVDNIRDLCE